MWLQYIIQLCRGPDINWSFYLQLNVKKLNWTCQLKMCSFELLSLDGGSDSGIQLWWVVFLRRLTVGTNCHIETSNTAAPIIASHFNL